MTGKITLDRDKLLGYSINGVEGKPGAKIGGKPVVKPTATKPF